MASRFFGSRNTLHIKGLLWFLTVTCSCCPYFFFGSAIMLVTYFVNFRKLNDHLFGKKLFIRFEGRMWDLILSVPDHCLSFYLTHDFDSLIILDDF